jgi:hypothetical protein
MESTSMRKSAAVPLTLLAAVAAFATGCHDTPESRNCVDAQGRIVPDTNCSTTSHTGTGGSGYHYIYGGSSGGRVGDAVVGGSSTPSESGVSRGGFGSGGGEGGE